MPNLPSFWQRFRRSSLAVNLTSVAGAMVLGRLIGLITLGYTARVFGPSGYGLVGYGSSIVAYAAIALSPGLVTWGVRAVARDRSRAGIYMVAINTIQMVLATLAYAAIAVFAWTAESPGDERTIILLSGLALFQTAFSADWVFNGLEQMRVSAGLSLVNSSLYTAGLLLWIHTPDHVFRLPIMTVALGFFTTSIGYLLLLRQVRLSWPRIEDYKEVLKSAGSLSLMVALVIVLHHANSLIVKSYLGTAELGLFLASYRLVELASTVPGLLSTVVLPRIARKAASSVEDARREAIGYARVLLWIGGLGTALCFAEADDVITFIYGNRFQNAAALLRIMAVGVFFNFAITGYTNTLIAFGRDRVMVAVVAVSSAVAVGGGLLMVPWLGSVGAAIVVALLDFAGLCVSIPAYRASVGRLGWGAWLGPAGLAALTVVLSTLLQRTSLPLIPRLALASVPFVYAAWRELRRLIR